MLGCKRLRIKVPWLLVMEGLMWKIFCHYYWMDKANICKYLLALKHIQCPFYVFKYICISLFVDLGCNFSHLSHCWFVIYFGVNHWKHLLWGLVCNHLITFLNDPIRPKNVVICLLVLECYYVIRLVGIKQIPSFLLSYNRLKRLFFSPGRVGKFDSCLDGVRNLNQNCQFFSAK